MYLLKFAGGLVKKVSDEYAKRIDDWWSDETQKSKLLKFKDGSKVLLSTLVEMLPVEGQETAEDRIAKNNTARIAGYLASSKTTDKKDWWIQRMKENQERVTKKLPWIHYDKQGNQITKEEAKKIYEPSLYEIDPTYRKYVDERQEKRTEYYRREDREAMDHLTKDAQEIFGGRYD